MPFWSPKTEVKCVKHQPEGLIFAVRHGKGLLQEQWAPGQCVLTWQDAPLITLWPDECPTCAGMVSAGSGENGAKAAEFIPAMAQWNTPFHDLPTSLSHLEPLLAMLPSGYYSLEDRQLYPTDGNGHFFWSLTARKQVNPATVSIMDREMRYYTPGPLYLLPTQSTTRFNPERAEYYRDKPDIRAIAWYFSDSYLCALLDGHHKACAAALEKRPLQSLVIAPVARYYPQEKRLTFSNGQQLTREECLPGVPTHVPVTALKSAYAESTNVSGGAFSWPEAFIRSASAYPPVEAASIILAAGDVSETRIRGIIEARILPDDDDIPLILQALFYTDSALFIPFARFLWQHYLWGSHNHLAFSLLAKRPSPQVDDLFVEFLIDDDGYHADLTHIVDDYFRKR